VNRKFIRRLAHFFEPAFRNCAYFERRFYWFSLVAIFGFPLYYLIWHHFYPQSYENLPLRIVGSCLFIPILFKEKWHARLQKIFPYYWYFCITYALPFFFTFMTLKTDASPVWVESSLVALFVMFFLLDWFMLLLLSLLGGLLASLIFLISTENALEQLHNFHHIPIFLFAVLIGIVSNYESEKIRIEQEIAMLATAGSIAHELRTPLAAIRSGTTGIKAILPNLIETYRLAKESLLSIPEIRPNHLKTLQKVLGDIELETRSANSIIEMLLISTRFSDTSIKQIIEHCSALECIQTALEEYPLSLTEKDLIFLDKTRDFQFSGSSFFVVHILLNLLKNSLRQIAQHGKGTIKITIENTERNVPFNCISFLDTAGGISPEVFPHIFERFYTTSQVKETSALGIGIGLAFCKDAMNRLGGKIECETVFGQHTVFSLFFPK
jgi:signal transduction histidine kinase